MDCGLLLRSAGNAIDQFGRMIVLIRELCLDRGAEYTINFAKRKDFV